MSGTFVYLKD